MKGTTMTELETAIAGLKPAIAFNARFTGIRREAKGFQFAWNATINGESFAFYCGAAHAKPQSPANPDRAVYQFDRWLSIEDAIVERKIKPTAPSCADVLYCLLLDANAMDETFEEWCANVGFDTDSRKALETYLECQTSGIRLRKAIGHTAFRALQGKEH